MAPVAGSGGTHPATCEGAVDRYIELYTADARSTGRDAQATQIQARRQQFIDDCKQRVADGRFTAEQLACAANAPTLEAGAACQPPQERPPEPGSGSDAGSDASGGSAGSGSAAAGSAH
jgi:hypothetical protein